MVPPADLLNPHQNWWNFEAAVIKKDYFQSIGLISPLRTRRVWLACADDFVNVGEVKEWNIIVYAYREVAAEEVGEEAGEAEKLLIGFVMECWWKWLKDKKTWKRQL